MENEYTKSIIKKWYTRLNFPKDTEAAFLCALDNCPIDSNMTIERYNTSCDDGKINLLYFLFFCEELEKKYKKSGIPERVMLDTLGDIAIWTRVWSELMGELYLGELNWLKRHLKMKLFRLGRLQFCISPSEFDIDVKEIKKGDKIIEIHIPEGEPLSPQECINSIDEARRFFSRFFPEYEYKLFTCHSWLLDRSLSEFLSPSSNILQFADLFRVVRRDTSDALLGYIFKWGIRRDELGNCPTRSSFAEKIKAAALDGRAFYECLGYIEK